MKTENGTLLLEQFTYNMGASASKNEEQKANDVDDAKANDAPTHREWLNVTASWIGGNMGVGRRLGDEYDINPLDDGTTLAYRVTNRLPLPRDKVWLAFDNYLEFVSAFNPTCKHSSGTENKVGEVVSFEIDASKYGINDKDANNQQQELTIKNDKTFVWQTGCVKGGSKLFEIFKVTARLYEDHIVADDDAERDNKQDDNNNNNNGCLLMVDFELVFANGVSKGARSKLLSNLTIMCNDYSKKIFDMAFDKCGLHFHGKATAKVPIDYFFGLFKDWKELRWVLSAKPDSLKMYDKDVRDFQSQRGLTILERVSLCDKVNHVFEYQVLNGPDMMPLRDTIRLTKISDNETQFENKISIYPRPSQDVEQLKKVYQYVIGTAESKLPDIIANCYKQSLKK